MPSGNSVFPDSYSAPDFMPRLTDTTATTKTFTCIDNNTTHDPVLCQVPDDVPAAHVLQTANSIRQMPQPSTALQHGSDTGKKITSEGRRKLVTITSSKNWQHSKPPELE